LQAIAFGRMLLVDELKQRDKELANNTLTMLQQNGSRCHVPVGNQTTTKQWQKILSASYDTAEALNSSSPN